MRDAFDRLINQATGSAALDEQISNTADKRTQRLAVLKRPDVPLHTTAMEQYQTENICLHTFMQCTHVRC